jgi:hypothetical protein
MATAKKPTKARALRASALKSTTAPTATATAYASKYAIGDHISHPMFGDGTVTAIHADKLTIEFPDSVTKQIVDGYVEHRNR